MHISRLSVSRPITVTMVTLAVALFGAVAFTRLPINLLPDISYPSLTIETLYPASAPSEVETLITKPIEEAVGVVSGVKRIRSISTAGKSMVTLEFNWDQKMDFAILDVRKKLDLVRMPEEADRPSVLRFDPSLDPVIRLELTEEIENGSPDLVALRRFADTTLKKRLEAIEGLAAVKVLGGLEEEIQVNVDEKKAAALGITLADISRRLREENINIAGGSLYEWEARYLVRTLNEFHDVNDIAETVMINTEGRRVRLRDIAEVKRGTKEREVIARYNGVESLELALYKEGDANTVSLSRRVTRALEDIQKTLPPGLKLDTVFNQARFIENAITEVISNSVFGGLLAMLILFFFLKNARLTFLVGLSIPVSVVMTFFLMYQTKLSLNVMSLGGLALGIGMLVDNSIVVLEAIARHLDKGVPAREAAVTGASEVGRAVVASTLTTVAVFLPIVFVEGIAAQLFKDLALTVTFALLTSLLVSLTLIPMAVSVFFRKGSEGKRGWKEDSETLSKPVLENSRGPRTHKVKTAVWHTFMTMPSWILARVSRGGGWFGRKVSPLAGPASRGFDKGFDFIARSYEKLFDMALDHRGRVIMFSLFLALAALGGVRMLGFSLVPALSQGEFTVKMKLPEGTPLKTTNEVFQSIESKLTGDPRIERIFGTTGQKESDTYTGVANAENLAQLNLVMSARNRGDSEAAVMKELREELSAFPRLQYEIYRPSYFSFKTPVEIDLFGDDLDTLRSDSEVLKKKLSAVSGLTDVVASLEAGGPEIHVKFSRPALAEYGLDIFQISNMLKDKIRGSVPTALRRSDKDIDIRVRIAEATRQSKGDLENLTISTRDGQTIALKAVASTEVKRGPAEIRRMDQRRGAVVTANLEGRDLGSVTRDIKPILEEFNKNYASQASLSGQNREMVESFRSLLMAALLAFFLVYLVMASQFESFRHPFVIIFSVPLGLVGAVAALFVTGTAVDVIVLIGFVMLSGIVVNNAIVLIDFTNRLRADGLPRREALKQAGKMRLRPILMTTATTVLGLTPMALGLGEGAELRSPLAITVIGGLLVSTFLTLVVIPVVYDLFDNKSSVASQQ